MALQDTYITNRGVDASHAEIEAFRIDFKRRVAHIEVGLYPSAADALNPAIDPLMDDIIQIEGAKFDVLFPGRVIANPIQALETHLKGLPRYADATSV